MKEARVEAYLTRQVKQMGGRCYKWVSPGTAGVPDRIVVLPDNRIAFVELKKPGETLEPLQEQRAKELADLGCDVWALDSHATVDWFVTCMAAR